MKEFLEKPVLETDSGNSSNSGDGKIFSIILGSYLQENSFFYWFVIGLTIFAISLFTNIVSGIGVNDEAWFLQVLNRMVFGETLYKDIFCGVTPLAFYLTVTFTYIFGTELFVIKILGTLIFTLSILSTVQIARKLDLTTTATVSLIIVLLAYTMPRQYWPGSLYTPLADLLFLSSFRFTLNWWIRKKENPSNKESLVNLIIAAVFAGLCFMSKQNIGVYLLVAMLCIVAINYKDNLFSKNALLSFIAVLSPFFIVSGILLLPVLASDGMEKLIYYGFLNKTVYLTKAHISYLNNLSELFVLLQAPLENLSAIIENLRFLLPLISCICLFFAIITSDTTKNTPFSIITIFSIAAFLGIFPRVDITHLNIALPTILLMLFYSLSYLIKSLELAKTVFNIISFCFILFLLNIFFNCTQNFFSPDFQFASLPHFHGVLVNKEQQHNSEKLVNLFSPYNSSKETFLISPTAGFYYLISSLENPTPFDYPLITTFGIKGEQEVISVISEKKIKYVWIQHSQSASLQPITLIEYIEKNMFKIQVSGIFTLYSVEPKIEEVLAKLKQPPLDATVETFLNFGLELINNEDNYNAVIALEKALEMNPNNFIAYNNLGIAYVKLGFIDEALQVYDEAIKRNLNYLSVKYNHNFALSQKDKTSKDVQFNNLINMSLTYNNYSIHDKVVSFAQKAILLQPNNSIGYNNLCVGYIGLKEIDKAIEAGETAVRLAPNSPLARGNLAWAKGLKPQ